MRKLHFADSIVLGNLNSANLILSSNALGALAKINAEFDPKLSAFIAAAAKF